MGIKEGGPDRKGLRTRMVYGPGRFLYRRLPRRIIEEMRRRIAGLLQYRYMGEEKMRQQMAERFLIRELALLFWGSLLVLLLGFVLCSGIFSGKEILQFERNPFGMGKKNVNLTLKDQEGSTEVSLEIQERQPDPEEIRSLYRRFFKKLKKTVCGDNPSLTEVTESLELPEQLTGYPFSVEYDIDQPDRIRPDGSLGEEALHLKKGRLKVQIKATASYLSWQEERTWQITIVPQPAGELSSFQKVLEQLKKKEKETRSQETLRLETRFGGTTVEDSGTAGSGQALLGLIGIALILGAALPCYRLKEKEQKSRETALRDFPVLVHLLVLYMGAGLSFGRAVHRISGEYKKGQITGDSLPHQAFEEIGRLDVKMQMGSSQKEACEKWAQDMDEASYRKLAVLLIQSFSKGAREAGYFMDAMEKEVFGAHVDRIKKRGEEASTRLLFPMVVLMGIVMVLVMFPALMEFQNF